MAREIDPEVLQQVIEVIAAQKEIPAADITIDSEFEALGLDSLDATEILFDLEEKLDVDIPNDAARAMKNVRQVVEGLQALIAGEAIDIPKPASDASA